MVISNANYPVNVINIGGELMVTLLIIVLIISVLLAYTKYWNKYNSNVIDSCFYPMLVTLIGIVVFKVILVI